jgi:hypothetical protein
MYDMLQTILSFYLLLFSTEPNPVKGALSISKITKTSATFSWPVPSAGSYDGFRVRIRLVGLGGTITSIDYKQVDKPSTSIDLTGLKLGQQYDLTVYTRAGTAGSAGMAYSTISASKTLYTSK